MLEKIPKVIDSLNKHQVEYVIIGGYAIIMHGFLRATEDIDIVLRMNEKNILNFQKALRVHYDDKSIDEINFDELSRYSVIRYGTPDNYYIDIISRIGEAFDYNNIERDCKTIDGIKYSIASVESLLQMKKNTFREKDQLDIHFLNNRLKNDRKV